MSAPATLPQHSRHRGEHWPEPNRCLGCGHALDKDAYAYSARLELEAAEFAPASVWERQVGNIYCGACCLSAWKQEHQSR